MTKTSQTYAEYLADKIGDKFFTVTFVKANGEIRKLNGRLGVTKHTASGKTTDTHDDYLCVYDVDKKGYRNVNVNTITNVVCGDFAQHAYETGKNIDRMTHEQFSVLSDMGVI
jgi:hypothetical protein|tara:strand:- start:2430 stop:2768 length:339 start_codon:yes stop_codon:yes gene_type:complete